MAGALLFFSRRDGFIPGIGQFFTNDSAAGDKDST
jgi:hypothetical protein